MAVDANDITSFAQQYVGTPYVWGGNSLTKGVDCSGLVQQVFGKFGISLPRTTYDQVNAEG
jgi:cell wall-associated NlpC family hydrolase